MTPHVREPWVSLTVVAFLMLYVGFGYLFLRRGWGGIGD